MLTLGELLDDGRLFCSYDIKDGAVLDLQRRKNDTIQLFVIGYTGETYTFNVTASDTVGYLKNMIKEKTSVEVDSQILLYGGECYTHFLLQYFLAYTWYLLVFCRQAT